MSRRPARATQADIARAIRAVEQTGARMAVEIAPDGTIRIVPYEAPTPANDAAHAPIASESRIRL